MTIATAPDISTHVPATSVKIVVLPGDHIGPEVTQQALAVLQAVFDLRSHRHGVSVHFAHGLVGGAAIDKTGTRY